MLPYIYQSKTVQPGTREERKEFGRNEKVKNGEARNKFEALRPST
jgi:hypothetical protein